MTATLTAGTARLAICVGELRQLFNLMDPAPFRERDLNPDAEAYILEWAREVNPEARLALEVQVTGAEPAAADIATVHLAVDEHFARCAADERLRLKRLFRRGRINLLVGIAFVAFANIIGDLAAELLGAGRQGRLIQESFAIGAWVALWRPVEIFLYDWWPIKAEARLFDRLSAIDVGVTWVPQAADRTDAPAAG